MRTIPKVREWTCWLLADGQLWGVGPARDEIVGVAQDERAAKALTKLPQLMNTVGQVAMRLEALHTALHLSGHPQAAGEVMDLLQDMAVDAVRMSEGDDE